MLRLPLGLSIFIPAVRFDRSAADWLQDPQERVKPGWREVGGTRAEAGSSWVEKVPADSQCQAPNSILVYPTFPSCGGFLYYFVH